MEKRRPPHLSVCWSLHLGMHLHGYLFMYLAQIQMVEMNHTGTSSPAQIFRQQEPTPPGVSIHELCGKW